MLYKPTFCCECGEKIERTEWKIWTNRRFCELCQTEYAAQDWTFKILGGICLALSIGFVVNLFVSNGRPGNDSSMKSLRSASVADRSLDESAARKPPQTVNSQNGSNSSGEPAASNLGGNEKIQKRNDDQPKIVEALPNQQNNVGLPVYFCGAATKKGSPCSRRVKGGGRCWQHLGQKAMLSDNKLLVSQ
jgi:hypothetical protein